MATKNKVNGVGDVGVCSECAYAYEPYSLGLDGKPTLARCQFSDFAVLWRRRCSTGRFKKK